MYKLYWAHGSANMVVHAALRQIGAEVELIEIDTENGQQRSPDYLKLNPHARVPTLIYDNDRVMYESAAISLFLAERHPEAKLAPLPGHADRGPFLQWMAYLTNTVQEASMRWWHPERHVDGEQEQVKFRTRVEQRMAEMMAFLDDHLAKNGPHLCGEAFYICDYFLVMLARWTRAQTKPMHKWPHINRLIRLALERPAYRQMLEEERVDQPV